jgi:hypothetical protein
MKRIQITLELIQDAALGSYQSSVIAKQELRAPADAKPDRLGKITQEALEIMLKRDHELWADIEESKG